MLYCVRENLLPPAYHSLYLSFFLSLQSKFLSQISQPLREPESSNFVYILRMAKYIVGKKTKMLRFIFAFFFHFSISLSNVIHKKICVKDFSGTTSPKILKFGTNVGYVLLYRVRENQPPPIYHSLYLSFFLSLQSNFLWQISQLWKPEFSNFVYTLRVAKYIVRKKIKMTSLVVLCKRESASCCLSFPLFVHFSLSPIRFSVTDSSAPIRDWVFKFCVLLESGQVYCGTRNKTAVIYFAFFFLFSFSHSNLIQREICDKYFSGTITSRIL